MKKSTHPLVEVARKGCLPQINLLRRALIEARGEKGLTRVGRSLAGGRHLVNTYRAAQAGVVNDDRYRRSHIEPSIEGAVSICLDISGSMDDRRDGHRLAPTIMEETMSACVALAEVLEKLGVWHHTFGCDVEHFDQQGWRDHPSKGATHPYRGVIYPFSQNGRMVYDGDALMRFPPKGGTHIATYAEEAIRALEGVNARHRLAVYMTDGACSSTEYLESLRQMAEAQGIKLVGVVMGHARMASEARQHPNGVFCPRGADFGKVVLSHLVSVIKG